MKTQTVMEFDSKYIVIHTKLFGSNNAKAFMCETIDFSVEGNRVYTLIVENNPQDTQENCNFAVFCDLGDMEFYYDLLSSQVQIEGLKADNFTLQNQVTAYAKELDKREDSKQ